MNIVVAYRESNLSKTILEKAIEHANKFNGKIFLVTSVKEVSDEQDLQNVEKARKALDEARKIVESKGIPCESHLVFPGISPGEDIVEFAKEKQADEIIVGVENKSKVGKFLLGSTAQHVILNAHFPVITVKN